jgi:hypothetical protein
MAFFYGYLNNASDPELLNQAHPTKLGELNLAH